MKTFKLRNIWFVTFSLALWASYALGLEVPELKARVNDYADILSPSTEQQLDAVLAELENTDSTQIAVLTIPSLEDEDIEMFSIRVAEKWKIGQKKTDNGAILLISKNDRALRIEVGYGLEGKLTDLISGRIIQYVIVPEFKRGDFDAGVISGVQAMIQTVRGEFTADKKLVRKDGRPSSSGAGLFPILMLLFLVNMLGRIKRPLGAVSGGIFFPIIAAILFGPGLLMLLMIPIGIIGGLILSLFGGPLSFASVINSGRNKNNHWRSGGGFGGFGGGFGGGGFGGFSGGGGGGFGGGGASGRW